MVDTKNCGDSIYIFPAQEMLFQRWLCHCPAKDDNNGHVPRKIFNIVSNLSSTIGVSIRGRIEFSDADVKLLQVVVSVLDAL